MFKCEKCNFESFNDKAGKRHMVEMHGVVPNNLGDEIPKETTKKEKPPNDVKKDNEQQIKKEMKNLDNNRLHGKYLHPILGKNIECETVSGKIYRGLLLEWGIYEVVIREDSGETILLFKHGLTRINEVSQPKNE